MPGLYDSDKLSVRILIGISVCVENVGWKSSEKETEGVVIKQSSLVITEYYPLCAGGYNKIMV
jgi:triosephosphate isomerase